MDIGCPLLIPWILWTMCRARIDERFGKEKALLFPDSTPEEANSRTWLKLAHSIQINHILLSVFYRAPRDPYGTLQRSKWLLTTTSSMLAVCYFTGLFCELAFCDLVCPGLDLFVDTVWCSGLQPHRSCAGVGVVRGVRMLLRLH
jgi:hypothetical protein